MAFHQPPSTNDFDGSPTHTTPRNFDAYLWNDALRG